ncbi:MAG: hypothetical protein R2784_11235 [Saprospiraceae bacterium]
MDVLAPVGTIFQPPFIDSCEVVIWDVYLGGNEHLLEALPFGEAPFTYNWSIGETTSSVQVTSPGTYCVTVTDATGCAASSCVFSIQSQQYHYPRLYN